METKYSKIPSGMQIKGWLNTYKFFFSIYLNMNSKDVHKEGK